MTRFIIWKEMKTRSFRFCYIQGSSSVGIYARLFSFQKGEVPSLVYDVEVVDWCSLVSVVSKCILYNRIKSWKCFYEAYDRA